MYRSSISPEEIEAMEVAAFPGKITVISGRGRSLSAAVKHLNEQRYIGFDTETKPVFQPHMPHCKTALLQLSSETHAYLFRLNEMGLPQEVADILANPNITKIGAAVVDDIRGLQRHTWFEADRFIDLQRFGDRYGIKDKSVRKMAAIILGTKVSKAQQLSNWENDMLTEPQQMYAATDAWICLRMYKKLLFSQQVETPQVHE